MGEEDNKTNKPQTKQKQKISNNLRMTSSVLKQDPNTDIKGSIELYLLGLKKKKKSLQILGLIPLIKVQTTLKQR